MKASCKFPGALVALMLLLLPLPGLAQSWTSEQVNNGVLFAASAYLPGGSGFSLTCGERVPGGPRAIPEIYEGWMVTRPDVLRLSMSVEQIGHSPLEDQRNDVVIVIGDKAFRLPEITWDEMDGYWSTDLQATGAMFDAIATARSFEIHSDAGVRGVSAQGFGIAYATLLDNCRAMFAANGKPWVSRRVVAPLAAPPSVRQVGEAEITRGCNGPSTYEPEAFLIGEIDGDGQPDLVLDWGRVSCLTGHPRPFCGASMCSADIFLSTRQYQRKEGDMLLSLGLRLQPLSNGNMAIAVGGSLAGCASVGKQACEFLFYWNGTELVELP